MQDTQSDPTQIIRDLVHGRWKSQALIVAVRLGIPELLTGGDMDAAEMARHLEVSEDGLSRLMRLLTAMGLFEQSAAGRFANNDASRCLLASAEPFSMRLDALHTLSPSMCIAWDNLEHSIRYGESGFEHATGMPIFEYLRDRPAEADVTYEFQAQATQWNVATMLAAGAFGESGTIVDVGGGNGSTLVAILEARPELRGLLYDLPVAIERARKLIAGNGVGARIELAEGDFFTSVPGGGDLYLISHVLHDWPDGRAEEILRRTAQAMGPDAKLLVTEIIKPEHGGGWLPAYLDLLMLVGLGGRERTMTEYAALLRRAGFTVTGTQDVSFGELGLGMITGRRD